VYIENPATVWSHTDPATAATFAGFVFAGTDTECWIWTGGLESQGGYGRWRPPGGAVIATHRWSYIAHHGPTDEPVIRHRCDVRCCANPHHLDAGTQAQNIRDTVERGSWRPFALPIWPHRAQRLRNLALAGDRPGVNTLTARCEQLDLFKR
jgi:HNH endonuclease